MFGRSEMCCATQPNGPSAPCSPLGRAYGVPLLPVPAARVVGSVGAEPRTQMYPGSLRMAQSGSFTARHMLQLGVSLACAVPGSRRRAARCLRRRRCLGSCGMFVFPSARRGVRASFDRYGHNRTVGVHVSWPDARPRAGTGTLGDTLSADGPREPCLGIVARTQKLDESQGNPKVVRTPPIVKGLESRGGKFERSSETQES